MDRQKVIFYRNLMFRMFIVGVVFALAILILTFVLWDIWERMSQEVFGVEKPEFRELVFTFFLNIRIVLIFFFLTPAIALHWIARGMK